MKVALFLFTLIYLGPLQANTSDRPSSDSDFLPFKETSKDTRLEYSLKNENLAPALISGVRTINQSVDTLMASIFYNLLDKSFPLPLGANLDLTTRYERNVHELNLGSYLVVDQFRLGPEYSKTLFKLNQLPINFSSSAGIDVTNLSIKSEASVAAKNANRSLIGRASSNWGGLLSVLTRILPPSFNPIELADPFEYLATPFLFPKTVEDLDNLPVATIRSIGISGGLTLSADLFEAELEHLRAKLKLPALDASIPYGVFRTGVYRIQILKKKPDVIWVAVREENDLGHKLTTKINNSFFIFSEINPLWQGLPTKIIPFDLELSQSKIKAFDQVFSFDLTKAEARESLNKILKGDLTNISTRNLTELPAGISQKFKKNTDSDFTQYQNTQSLYIWNNEYQQSLTHSFVTLQKSGDTSNYLEVEQKLRSANWNALVGEQQRQYQLKLRVKLASITSTNGEADFIIDPEVESPFDFKADFFSKDRFFDTQDYEDLKNHLSYISIMNLDKYLPRIPIFASDQKEKFIEEKLYENPLARHETIAPTPVLLGKSQTHTSIYFPHKYLTSLMKRTKRDIYKAIELGFSNSAYVKLPENIEEASDFHSMNFITLILRPLRLFNIYLPKADMQAEQIRVFQAINKMKTHSTPEYLSENFAELMDTHYPEQLVRALSLLDKNSEISKNIQIIAQADMTDEGSPDVKKMLATFSKLDRLTITRGPNYLSETLFPEIRSELKYFDNPADVQYFNLQLEGIAFRQEKNKQQVSLQTWVKVKANYADIKSAKLYVRLEQGQSLNLGRFRLAEKIIELNDIDMDENGRFYIPLSFASEKSEWQKFNLNYALRPYTQLDLFLNISQDGYQWGQERLVNLSVDEYLKIQVE